MVMVHGLRILTELSFYYAFASFISVVSGGRYAVAGLVIQTLCFALSAARGKRWLRLVLLTPMAGFFLLPDVPAVDAAVFLGAAAYLVHQAFTGSYPLEWNRHVELFSAFWKAYGFFAFLVVLGGGYDHLVAASLPVALVMLFSSVLAMRTLRHTPETYLQRRYQLINLLSVGAVTCAAAVIGSSWFLSACGAVAGAAYRTLICPLLMFLLVVLVMVLRAIAALFSWVKLDLPEGQQVEVKEIDNLAKELGLGDVAGATAAGKWVLFLLGAVLIAVVLWLFFRWIDNLGLPERHAVSAAEVRLGTSTVSKGSGKTRGSTAVQKVRAQYRRFLKLYQTDGGEVRPGDTSRDIGDGARQMEFDAESCDRLRELYIRARYAGEADREDAVRAKELYAAIRKAHH